MAIAESDIEDYPGLWLRGTSGNGLAATFPPYPLQGNAGKAIATTESPKRPTTSR